MAESVGDGAGGYPHTTRTQAVYAHYRAAALGKELAQTDGPDATCISKSQCDQPLGTTAASNARPPVPPMSDDSMPERAYCRTMLLRAEDLLFLQPNTAVSLLGSPRRANMGRPQWTNLRFYWEDNLAGLSERANSIHIMKAEANNWRRCHQIVGRATVAETGIVGPLLPANLGTCRSKANVTCA